MGSRPRLAFFTPLNPHRSGVCDYSEELLPHLAAHADVDVVVDDYEPTHQELRASCRFVRKAAFDPDARRYDGFIYQVANNLSQHGYMLDFMARHPGMLVLHDTCLQYLILGVTAFEGNLDALERILAVEHGPRAKSMARRLVLSLLDPYELSFARPLIEVSPGIAVHSEHARDWLSRCYPEKLTQVIPMGIESAPPAAPSRELRERFGIAPGDFVLASISTLTYTKRLHLVLEALELLDGELERVKLLVVGGGPLGREVRKLLASPSLAGRVIRTGWVSAEVYRGLIALSDVVVDLRYPTGGETSASLLRALGAGVPAILSEHGSFVEIPDSCSIKVPVDGNEPSRVAKIVSELAHNGGTRDELAAGARKYVERHHSLERAASGYLDFVGRVASVAQTPSEPMFSAESRPLKGRVLAGAFKTFRFVDLYRKYGWGDTFARVRSELRR